MKTIVALCLCFVLLLSSSAVCEQEPNAYTVNSITFTLPADWKVFREMEGMLSFRIDEDDSSNMIIVRSENIPDIMKIDVGNGAVETKEEVVDYASVFIDESTKITRTAWVNYNGIEYCERWFEMDNRMGKAITIPINGTDSFFNLEMCVQSESSYLTSFDSILLSISLFNESNVEQQETQKYSTEEVSAAVEKILSYKNTETSKAWKLFSEYSSYMTLEQRKSCLLSYGRWAYIEDAEDALKEYLKSPRSYYRYSGSVGSPSLQDNGQYRVQIDLEYGATNSFGAEIKDEVTMYVFFEVDSEYTSIRLIKAEPSPYYKWEFSK